MRLETISETSKQILDAMRNLIGKGETNRLKENTSGWQYGGEEFNKVVESLRQQMQRELENQGFHVKALLFLFKNKLLISLAGGWLYRSTFPQRRKHIELSLPGKTDLDDPNKWKLDSLDRRPITTRYILLHRRSADTRR